MNDSEPATESANLMNTIASQDAIDTSAPESLDSSSSSTSLPSLAPALAAEVPSSTNVDPPNTDTTTTGAVEQTTSSTSSAADSITIIKESFPEVNLEKPDTTVATPSSEYLSTQTTLASPLQRPSSNPTSPISPPISNIKSPTPVPSPSRSSSSSPTPSTGNSASLTKKKFLSFIDNLTSEIKSTDIYKKLDVKPENNLQGNSSGNAIKSIPPQKTNTSVSNPSSQPTSRNGSISSNAALINPKPSPLIARPIISPRTSVVASNSNPNAPASIEASSSNAAVLDSTASPVAALPAHPLPPCPSQIQDSAAQTTLPAPEPIGIEIPSNPSDAVPCTAIKTDSAPSDQSVNDLEDLPSKPFVYESVFDVSKIELDSLKQQIVDLNQLTTNLEQQNKLKVELEQQNKSYQHEIEVKQKQINELEQQNKSNQLEIESKQKEIDQLKSQLKITLLDLESKSTTVESLKQTLSSLTEEVQSLKATNKTQTEENEALKGVNRVQNDEIVSLKAMNTTKMEEVQSLKVVCSTQRNDLDKCTKDIEKLKSMEVALKKEIEKYKKELSKMKDLMARVDAVEMENHRLSREVNRLETEKEEERKKKEEEEERLKEKQSHKQLVNSLGYGRSDSTSITDSNGLNESSSHGNLPTGDTPTGDILEGLRTTSPVPTAHSIAAFTHLNERLSELMKEREEHIILIGTLQIERDEWQSEKLAISSRVYEMEKQFKAFEDEKVAMDRERKEWKEKQLQELLQAKESLESERNHLKKKVMTLSQQVERLNKKESETKSYNRQLELMKTSQNEYMEEIVELRRERDELTSNVNLYKTALQNELLKKAPAPASSSYSYLPFTSSSTPTQAPNLASEVEALRQLTNDLTDQLSDQNVAAQQMKKINAILGLRVKELEERFAKDLRNDSSGTE